jgi:hypothetical protein
MQVLVVSQATSDAANTRAAGDSTQWFEAVVLARRSSCTMDSAISPRFRHATGSHALAAKPLHGAFLMQHFICCSIMLLR